MILGFEIRASTSWATPPAKVLIFFYNSSWLLLSQLFYSWLEFWVLVMIAFHRSNPIIWTFVQIWKAALHIFFRKRLKVLIPPPHISCLYHFSILLLFYTITWKKWHRNSSKKKCNWLLFYYLVLLGGSGVVVWWCGGGLVVMW